MEIASFANKFWLSAALLVAVIAAPAVQAEIVVISNLQLPITTLSRDEVSRIYLGKTKYLPNGSKIVPIDQKQGTISRSKFYSDIIHKTETEIKSYWSRITFSGQGNPPLQQDDDVAVKNLVAEDANCLGYIDKSLVDDSVKIVYSQPLFGQSKNNLSNLAMNAMMVKG
jgi:ABC-type phosphate transport system substrate-binding protein